MSFFKKFSKLDDVAFHLVNHLNKKKLKLNLLLIQDWEKIVGSELTYKSNLKNIAYDQKSDSCSIEIACDPSIVLELRSQLPEIILRMEQSLGIKVKKLNFFQDIFVNQLKKNTSNDKNDVGRSKNTNKSELNDIKDNEVSSIFERINSSIKNEKK
jgi:hypothetical protein